jgi:hypothetical protein
MPHDAHNCIPTLRPSGQLHKPLAAQPNPVCSSSLPLLHCLHRETVPSDDFKHSGNVAAAAILETAQLASSDCCNVTSNIIPLVVSELCQMHFMMAHRRRCNAVYCLRRQYKEYYIHEWQCQLTTSI